VGHVGGVDVRAEGSLDGGDDAGSHTAGQQQRQQLDVSVVQHMTAESTACCTADYSNQEH
jgi:hypothetical protein